MTATFLVLKETHGRWPQGDGGRAVQWFDLDLVEVNPPNPKCASTVWIYRLSRNEVASYWGRIEGRTVEVGIDQIQPSPRGVVLLGRIISVGN